MVSSFYYTCLSRSDVYGKKREQRHYFIVYATKPLLFLLIDIIGLRMPRPHD
jgi:hypothetical protein